MSNKKKKSNGRQDGGFMFFVPDQGEGAALLYFRRFGVLYQPY